MRFGNVTQHVCLRRSHGIFPVQFLQKSAVILAVCIVLQGFQPSDILALELTGIEYEIKHKSRNRQNHHKQKPRDFIIGIIIRGNDIDYAGDFREPAQNIKIRHITAESNHNSYNRRHFKHSNKYSEDISERNVVIFPFNFFFIYMIP